jgi:CRISPR-associated protein Cmr2
MTSYLFLLTIGPVQDFIAAARRTRDLWAGSQLLSDLSRTAATSIANDNDNKTDMIFPFSDKKQPNFREHDVVNRIMAKVDEENIKEFGEKLEKAIRCKFHDLYREVLQKFPDSHFDRATAEKHLEDLLEINWAAVEFNGDNYKDAREQLEHVLAARKNTRDFEQTDWSKEGKLRSSIDGQRESVIDEKEYPNRYDTDAQKKGKLNNLWKNFRISGAERLSGVDLFKRWYTPELSKEAGEDIDFPSTSHIAALPFIWRYVRATSEYQSLDNQDSHASQQEQTFRKAIEVYARKLEEIQSKVNIQEKVTHQNSRFASFMPYDASILYDSRLREITDSDELKNRDSGEVKKARLYLDSFYEQLETKDRPSPYYAILLADGDAMGQALDGLSNDYKLHQQFSQRLDDFASDVRGIVESHWGALIYSGGDDVLALMPLHSLLACAKALHERFGEAWSNFSALGDASKPTLSMGIAIAHYMEPLSDTLKLARDAEKKAKAFPGIKDQGIPAKNALAITLSKRSGSDRTIVGSWLGEFYQRISHVIQLYRTNTIPDGYAFELENLSLRLGSKINPAILRAEAKRIAKRKREGKGSDELLTLAEKLPETKSENTFTWNIEMFVNELVIASELARALGPIVTQPTVGAQESKE